MALERGIPLLNSAHKICQTPFLMTESVVVNSRGAFCLFTIETLVLYSLSFIKEKVEKDMEKITRKA